MPFQKEFLDIYELGIKKTAEDNDIIAQRVDEQQFDENMLHRIYRQIENCDFIIAEMTGRNPNVFYEVGYAHAKGKLCALITQNAADIPFDLKHHPHIVYDGSIRDLIKKLAPRLVFMKHETEKRKITTITPTVKNSDGYLNRDEDFDRGEITIHLDLSNNSSIRSPEIEAIYIKTTTHWSVTVGGKACPAKIDNKKGIKISQVMPTLRNLSPGAFSQYVIELRRMFWNKYSGDERQGTYTIKGKIGFQIDTSEGNINFDHQIEEEFDEIPF